MKLHGEFLKKELSSLDKIHARIKEIGDFIGERNSPEYKQIFEEFNIFTIQEKMKRIQDIIDNDSTLNISKNSHFIHTLVNFSTGLLTLDRVKKGVASQQLQASNQENIIEVNLHLDKMLQNKDYFRESLETQHGYENTLH